MEYFLPDHAITMDSVLFLFQPSDKMDDDCLEKLPFQPFRSHSGSDEDVADATQALREEGRDSDLGGHEYPVPPVEESQLPQEVAPQMVSGHSILLASVSRFIVDCIRL